LENRAEIDGTNLEPTNRPDEAMQLAASTSNGSMTMSNSVNRVHIEGYELSEVLGRGGAGIVFKAKQILTGRLAAIKVLNSNMAVPSMYIRFQQEAKALCKFNHANVVRVYDFGMTADGLPYIVMELVGGITLSDLIQQKGVIPWDTAVKMFIQICDALEHAHAQGVIHRDLKPGNIMVLDTDTTNLPIKILDFGIAKVATDNQASMHLTATGEVFGSPLYMSPEQCSGTKVDKRTDIYSLGCIMYEALVGQPPHTGENPFSVAVKHLQSTPDSLSTIRGNLHLPSRLESIIFRALEKNVDARYQSMGQLRSALVDLTDKRLLRRLHLAASLSDPTSVKYFKLAIGAFALVVLLAVSIVLFRSKSTRQANQLHIPTTGVVEAKLDAPPVKPTEQVVASPIKPKEQIVTRETTVSAQPKGEGALKAEIAAALPVGVSDIEKAIAASAILPADSPIQVSQSKTNSHMITVKTSKYQATQKDIERDALLVASKVVEADPKVSSLRVFFSYPENPAAYDQVAFNQTQLKTVADGKLNTPGFLQGIKLLESNAAKKLDTPTVTETATSSITAPFVDPRLPRSPAGNRLRIMLPNRNPQYLDQLGRAFEQCGLVPPNAGFLPLRRLRAALHILSMSQTGQSIKECQAAYNSIEAVATSADPYQTGPLLRSEEQALGLPIWRVPEKDIFIQSELNSLRWPKLP
jgi:serine/threonine protein kinase